MPRNWIRWEKREYNLEERGWDYLCKVAEGVPHGDYTHLVWREDQKTEMARLLAAPCLWRDFGWKDRQRITKKPSPSWHIGPQWFKIPKWKGFISISGGNQKESLAQWLIPSTFQFPALESQGIRALQRRILAEGNVFCPASFLTMVRLFWLCAADFSPSSLQKNPKPNTQSPKQSRRYSLGNTLPWKFQSLDVQSSRPGQWDLFPGSAWHHHWTILSPVPE